jgi:hypothetical protein
MLPRTLINPLDVSSKIVVGYLQKVTAGLAVYSVHVMTKQPAAWTFKPHFCGLQDGARQAEEQGDAKNHNDD